MKNNKDNSNDSPPLADIFGCDKAGEAGHSLCGICPTHKKPRLHCGCRAKTISARPRDKKW